ncbi:MAG: class I SAM-dependent methyltransferase [Acidobacteriota bacterium]
MAFVKKGHLYHRCGACGHVFVWPQPTEEENAAHYRLGSATQFLTAIRPWFEELARRRVELLAQIPDCAPGRLLDLGAGQGFFVKKARDCGWQAEGVESSADAVRFGADDLGVELIEADLVEALANQPSGTWDVLTLWHSLEHTEDPGRVLRQSRRALRPGGCLVLNSPNLDSTIYRMLGRHWTWIYCPGHLQYFSLRSLSDWLEREGFTILLAETWTHAPNLYFLLEEACLLRVSEFLSDHGFAGLSRLGNRLTAFVYQPFHQQVIQQRLNWFYRRTPGLDARLRRRGRGHEFYLVARKPESAGGRQG